MKKQNPIQEIRILIKREQKRLRRIRLNKIYKGINSSFTKDLKFSKKIDNIIISKFRSPLYEFFKLKLFIDEKEIISDIIIIPSNFSFLKNYEESISKIKNLIASIFSFKYINFTIDFSECNYVDQASLFLLRTVIYEFRNELQNLNRKLKVYSTNVNFKFIDSKNENVNKILFVTGLLPRVNLKNEGLMPVYSCGFFKGSKSQKHYSENKKGVIVTRIVEFINRCLSHHDYIFNADGTNYIEGLVSEILNNSEDHSPFNSYHVTANFFKEVKGGEMVGEMNLSFLNFGYSFFEGFELTKNENSEIYHMMEKLYDQVNVGLFKKPFSKENLFTLYALQDGITRLKFEEESRGTGTMKFINSFFAFGDYEDNSKAYNPKLTILTGATQLICDNKFKPFLKDGVYFISLNLENDLAILPERSNLNSLSIPFPGTLLNVKIYLNKDHLNKKINGT